MEGVALSITPFHYLCTVAVLDPNNAGAGKTVVGDWLLDNTGYPFIITNIVSGGRIEVYDVNERGNVYGRQGQIIMDVWGMFIALRMGGLC